MVLAVICYAALVGCLLFMTIFQPAAQQAEVVKVNITDFQPPERREMHPEQKRQLEEIEKSARKISNQAAAKVDPAAENENIRRTVENLDVSAELAPAVKPASDIDGRECHDACLSGGYRPVGKSKEL